MEWRSVSSSTISRVGYDASSMTMTIEFMNGGIYEYYDIPQSLVQDLLAAPSPGQFLAQNVKGQYRYARV